MLSSLHPTNNQKFYSIAEQNKAMCAKNVLTKEVKKLYQREGGEEKVTYNKKDTQGMKSETMGLELPQNSEGRGSIAENTKDTKIVCG